MKYFMTTFVFLLVAATGFCLIGGGGSENPAPADYYVASSGSDANPGTFDKPFATLQRARDAVHELKTAQPDKDILVMLRGGYYLLTNAVIFGMADSANAGHSITYAAYPGEQPVLGSGVAVTGWEKAPADLPGLPAAAAGNVWCAPLPKGISYCTTLFKGHQVLPRSRSSGFVPASSISRKEIEIPKGILPADAVERGMDLRIIPEHSWVMNLLLISEWNPETHIAKTAVPATYKLAPVPNRYFPDGTAWIENAVEFMNGPGQWALDKKSRMIYLWHEQDTPPADIVAPILTELVRVEGTINYDESQDIPVKGLVFRGLAFMHADFRRWQPDKFGWGLQHDWEMFDRSTAMLRFRGAEDCAVRQCEFAASGSAAIRCDLHAQRIRIEDNEIHQIGGVGVLLAGYGPGTKDVNHDNMVRNNRIYQAGEVKWDSPGIFVWQSGDNQIVSNRLSHLPYSGIVVSCRAKWNRTTIGECGRTIRWNEIDTATDGASQDLDWAAGHTQSAWQLREPFLHSRSNAVAYNNISDVMLRMDDGNGIYVSGAGNANEISRNYIHDLDTPRLAMAVRCDDDQHETLICNNIIANCSVDGIITKGLTTITNNIIYNLRSKTLDGVDRMHNRGYLGLIYGDCAESVIQRNIFYTLDPGVPVLTENRFPRFGVALMRQCNADYNLYFSPVNPEWGARYLAEQRPYGIEEHSLAVDPLFVNPANGDFRLKSGSLALDLGFVPIDIVTAP